MLVKCKSCGEKVDRDKAYKIVVNGKNNYYCSEDEYSKLKENQLIKNNTYSVIYEIFGRRVTNTILFKEIGELDKIYTYKTILSYLNDNKTYLESVMSKDFSSEYAKIRYFTAILKNNLSDYKEEKKIPDKQISIDIPKDNYKPRNRKKSLVEFEEEIGGSHS